MEKVYKFITLLNNRKRGDKVSLSEARKKANEKYINSLDEIKIRVKKGSKQTISDISKNNGDSLNGYIKKAIKSQVKTDTGEDIDL